MHRFCAVYRLNCFALKPREMTSLGKKFYGQTLFKKDLEKVLALPWSTDLDVWPNHAEFVPDIFDRMIANNTKISVFREPKSRIISMLAHASDRIGTAIKKIKEGGSIRCGGGSWLMTSQIRLEDFNALDFVLLTEEYNLSLIMMRRRFGWRMADIIYMPIKVSLATREQRSILMSMINDTKNEVVSRGVAALFKCTTGEYDEGRLYQKAQEKFRAQWDSFGSAEQAGMQQELKLFEATLQELWRCCEAAPRQPHLPTRPALSQDIFCRDLEMDDDVYVGRANPSSRRRMKSFGVTYPSSPCWEQLPSEYK